MCLRTIDAQPVKCKPAYGYSVKRKERNYNRDGEGEVVYRPLRYPDFTAYKLGCEYCRAEPAEDIRTSQGMARGQNITYPSGFHLLTTKAAARNLAKDWSDSGVVILRVRILELIPERTQGKQFIIRLDKPEHVILARRVVFEKEVE